MNRFCFSIDTGLCSAALEKATQLASTSGNDQYTADEIQALSDLDHGENIFITKVNESWYQPDSKRITLAGKFTACFHGKLLLSFSSIHVQSRICVVERYL